MKKAHESKNFIAAALLTVAAIVLASVLGDYYFDLNDDVLMKDILSGVYTGTPEGHNIQMLYPVSALISLFYRVFRAPDWYGIFLCACQYGCMFIILERALSRSEGWLAKIEAGAAVFCMFLGAFLSHFLFVQYTFTCGLLSATAVFLILTHDGKKRADLVIAVILIIFAYLIRSEMLLLTLPIVGVGIFIKWYLERMDIKDYYQDGIYVSRYGEKKADFKKYVLVCVFIIAGIVASQVSHRVAYSPPEWKEFNRLFDARTELYDFQFIPDYEGNEEFYESIGLDESEQKLLVNYNFGLDEEINADILWAVADYASSLRNDETPLVTRLSESISHYFYRLRHVAMPESYEYPMTDSPFNIIVGLLYLGAIIIFLFSGEKDLRLPSFISLLLLFACRSALWLFIIIRGRDPIRITHPLYIMEIAVLFGMIFNRARKSRKNVFIPLIIIALTAIIFIPNQLKVIGEESEERAKMRAHYDALYEYFDSNPEAFYFVDVYTSVAATDTEKTFSEKMFYHVDNSQSNHDLMGGWASKSPLYYDKLTDNGFSSMEDAILTDDVYVVTKEASGIDWITDYYRDKGKEVTTELKDTVGGVFLIYSVKER